MLREAQVLVERWRRHYNAERPHSALGNLTPQGYAQRAVPRATLPRGRARSPLRRPRSSRATEEELLLVR